MASLDTHRAYGPLLAQYDYLRSPYHPICPPIATIWTLPIAPYGQSIGLIWPLSPPYGHPFGPCYPLWIPISLPPKTLYGCPIGLLWATMALFGHHTGTLLVPYV